MKTDHTGFGVVELLLLLAASVAVILSGLYVYHLHNRPTSYQSNACFKGPAYSGNNDLIIKSEQTILAAGINKAFFNTHLKQDPAQVPKSGYPDAGVGWEFCYQGYHFVDETTDFHNQQVVKYENPDSVLEMIKFLQNKQPTLLAMNKAKKLYADCLNQLYKGEGNDLTDPNQNKPFATVNQENYQPIYSPSNRGQAQLNLITGQCSERRVIFGP